MRDIIYIGPVPTDEHTSTIPNQYQLDMHRFKELLIKYFGPPRGTAKFEYIENEVVVTFEDGDEIGMDYGLRCEGEGPATWDDEGPYDWPLVLTLDDARSHVRNLIDRGIEITSYQDGERNRWNFYADDQNITHPVWLLLCEILSDLMDGFCYSREYIAISEDMSAEIDGDFIISVIVETYSDKKGESK